MAVKKKKTKKSANKVGRRSLGLAPWFSARLTKAQWAKLDAESEKLNLPRCYVLRAWVTELEARREKDPLSSDSL